MSTGAYSQMPAFGQRFGQADGQTRINVNHPSYSFDRRFLDAYSDLMNTFLPRLTVATSAVSVRHAFLRKVYGILSAQLLLTVIVGASFVYFQPLAAFIQSNSWILWVCFVASLGLIFAMQANSRVYPTNMIILAVFTFFEAILVGVIVTYYSVNSVLQALFMTCIVTMALTVYTFQSRRDFSSWDSGLFAALLILLEAGILQIYLRNGLLELVLGTTGAIIFSMYIIYDTHKIMEKVSPEEYIDASVNLYLDIINLFVSILRIYDKKKD